MRRIQQARYAVQFLLWLAWQVPLQAWKIARDVLTPGLFISPSIIEFPLRARTPLEIAAIESAITITPGTLTLGIAEADDEQHTKSLFVHFLYAHTHDGAIAELEDMESRLLRATRGCSKEEL
ncbi:MAG: Na+/H+ antiporter subunit E [Actinobacteria bacterium]|jgi:multicomponent Na+:H+ antiporter subunit E|nr:Na+/H+ antiporter subunit E [Actinomycetota bacterium]